MAFQIGISSTKVKEVEVIAVPEIKNSKIDSSRFEMPTTKELIPNLVVGYCYCDNCKENRNFKKTNGKVICISCYYIISYKA